MSETTLRPQLKGSQILGLIEALRRGGQYDRVLHELTPATRRLLVDPPLISAWSEFATLDEVCVVVEKIYGFDAVRTLGRESVTQTMATLVRAPIEGMLRLFGATPHTLCARMSLFGQLTTKNLSFAYRSTGAKSCILTVTPAGGGATSTLGSEYAAGQLESIFLVCRAQGTVTAKRQAPSSIATEYHLRWT
jgi:hypothetical protein